MQNMNYYYDFSGQKFGYPLSLSINSFDQKAFSRHTSLELAYVLKGEYEAITKHFSHIINEHELLILAPNDIHMIRPVSKNENIVLTIHIDFARFPEAMVGDIKNSFESTVCTNDKNLELLKKLKHKIGKLIHIFLDGNINLFELNSIMMDIVCITSNQQHYPIERLPLQSTHRKNYLKAIQYIDKHYHEDLHLSDVADTLMFSISYTSKLFKKYTGIPFVKYLAMVRIRESMDDLLEGIKSIEQIASEYGMPNSKAYTSAFKAQYGIVPSEYRKQFMNNMRFNEDKKIQKMSINSKHKLLLEHLVKDVEDILYENAGIKIKNDNGHIICSIKTDKDVKSTITQSNEKLIIDITKI